MVTPRIVCVCRDIRRFERISRLTQHRIGGCLTGITDIEDLPSLLPGRSTRLIVISCPPEDEVAVVARGLLHVSRADATVPLVILGDEYDSERVLTAFQMGVADYLQLDRHAEQLATVMNILLNKPDGPGDGTTPTTATPESRGQVGSLFEARFIGV